MIIDLNKIKVHVLTIPENKDKIERLKRSLNNSISFEIFYGITLPRPIGCDISLIKLWNKIKPPCLVLEDDCCITDEYKTIFEIPDDSDAIHLGTSIWGVKNGESKINNLELKKYNDLYFKINCMTATHAILFLTNNYLANMIEIGKKYPILCEVNGHGIDYYTSQDQYKFNVYGVAKPFFYQEDSFTSTVTLPSLEDLYLNKHL